MATKFQKDLQKYAELAVRVGLNLRSGQRLLVRAPAPYGIAFEHAPLVRYIAESAYKAGARLVDVFWGDEQLELIRFAHAPRDSFTEFPRWRASGPLDYAERAVRAAPNSPALLDTLALAYADAGRPDKAIEVQARAQAMLPEDPYLRLNLARFYAQAGEKRKAKAELDRLAALGDRFPKQDEVAALTQGLGGRQP